MPAAGAAPGEKSEKYRKGDVAIYDGYEEGFTKAIETIKKISEKYQIQT